ncbi:uncharacterized protein IL334_000857 [Kwoniella shivajii]|uniref:Uncharacterized protein n=1 Tax=Kwoniella shivajii TaxID=564305 RepID=A0ABZ1CQN8_9TREE|nr:hypothetical protein IL334_000857 [Kwoniella shivajii]
MTTTSDTPLDPLLREPPVPSPSKTAGTKRKTRGSGSTAAIIPPSTTTTRLTRRRSAAQPGNVNGETVEPARGEEENLNGYWGPASNKRSRRVSPTKPSKVGSSSARFYPSTEASDGKESQTGAASVPGIDTEIPMAGIEELAAAATAANDKPLTYIPYYTPMYPVGLSPFRYPCLTPGLPNPSPGDPNNPNFKRFDPHVPLPSLSSMNSSRHPPDSNTSTNIEGNIDPQLANLSAPTQPSQEGQIQEHGNNVMDQATSDSANAAYESISALLSASQSVFPPTLESIDYGQGQ